MISSISVKYGPNLTKHISMESLFFRLSDDVKNLKLKKIYL